MVEEQNLMVGLGEASLVGEVIPGKVGSKRWDSWVKAHLDYKRMGSVGLIQCELDVAAEEWEGMVGDGMAQLPLKGVSGYCE
ncbi:hypothetical protein V6N11_063415 [Hibiscus sabdariffa]|uniref:Uncharacterized protein n=2 Tax=Hibiscus sabdariffa TaxID=183260 RepID=A0ABR2BHS8_9ROSI